MESVSMSASASGFLCSASRVRVSFFYGMACAVLGSFSLLYSIPLCEYTRHSPVDGHLGCFPETFLNHCHPRSPQGVEGRGGKG